MAESKILKLPFDLPDAQTVGERGVKIEGLAGDPPLFGLRQRTQKAHVVQSLREDQKHHTNIAGHGQQHFAQGFGTLTGMTVLTGCMQATDLLHPQTALDQIGHCAPRHLGNLSHIRTITKG